MRGKLGIVVGFGIGYVLGTRAGRERYEQISAQAQRVWQLEPVQRQVQNVKRVALSSALAIPRTLWNGTVKVVKAAAGSGTPGERLDSVLEAGRGTVEEVAEVVSEEPKPAVQQPAASTSAAKKPAAKQPAAKKPAARKPATKKKTGES